MNERRIARRYDVAVPVLVRLPGLPRRQPPRGLTRDISTSGLYFTMDQPPRTGSRVELTLTLPGSLTGSADVLVEVVGRVVRVDRRADARADARVDPRVRARLKTQTESPSRSAPAAAASFPVGVAAHIERYDIISTHPRPHGSAHAV